MQLCLVVGQHRIRGIVPWGELTPAGCHRCWVSEVIFPLLERGAGRPPSSAAGVVEHGSLTLPLATASEKRRGPSRSRRPGLIQSQPVPSPAQGPCPLLAGGGVPVDFLPVDGGPPQPSSADPAVVVRVGQDRLAPQCFGRRRRVGLGHLHVFHKYAKAPRGRQTAKLSDELRRGVEEVAPLTLVSGSVADPREVLTWRRRYEEHYAPAVGVHGLEFRRHLSRVVLCDVAPVSHVGDVVIDDLYRRPVDLGSSPYAVERRQRNDFVPFGPSKTRRFPSSLRSS